MLVHANWHSAQFLIRYNKNTVRTAGQIKINEQRIDTAIYIHISRYKALGNTTRESKGGVVPSPMKTNAGAPTNAY